MRKKKSNVVCNKLNLLGALRVNTIEYSVNSQICSYRRHSVFFDSAVGLSFYLFMYFCKFAHFNILVITKSVYFFFLFYLFIFFFSDRLYVQVDKHYADKEDTFVLVQGM